MPALEDRIKPIETVYGGGYRLAVPRAPKVATLRAPGKTPGRARKTLRACAQCGPMRRTAPFTSVLVSSSLAANAQNKPRENPAEALEMPTVEVIGTTPLPGLGTPIRDVLERAGLHEQGSLRPTPDERHGLSGAEPHRHRIERGAAGNPFQPDISFRGFSASPLLGTPQGVSIFQDGVRVNEPFGDIVNWDLIPQSAIASIQLIPGSNPAFGLNTLGGAGCDLHEKRRAVSRWDIQLSGGSSRSPNGGSSNGAARAACSTGF